MDENKKVFTKEDVIEGIEKVYGFKNELIENAEICGIWSVRFEVNGIKYYGHTAHVGALPQLSVEGYSAEHFDNHDIPITEHYYNECIKGKKICLRRRGLEGEGEETDIKFSSQEEAKDYIGRLDEPSEYFYDFAN